MLTQEVLKELLHYNPDTGIFTWKYRGRQWFKSERSCNTFNTKHAGQVTGYTTAARNKPYLIIGILGVNMLAHRLAFLYMDGVLPCEEVDHINGNGCCNIWSNIRLADKAENAKNRRIPTHNTSGVIGVCWHKATNKWIANITVDQKRKHLGVFEDICDASSARKQAEIKYKFHTNHGQVRPL